MPSPKGKKLFPTILVILAILIASIIGAASMQPDQFRVERSIVINAASQNVFEQVNNLHHWENWSPWAKLDPNAKSDYEGPDAGVGAVMLWDGNHEVGKGKMTIIESRPNEYIKFRLDFEKPMKGTSTAEFTFREASDGTNVSWSMSGENNLLAKIMSLFMNCEKMMGNYFDKGLNSLKALVEKK